MERKQKSVDTSQTESNDVGNDHVKDYLLRILRTQSIIAVVALWLMMYGASNVGDVCRVVEKITGQSYCNILDENLKKIFE